MKDNLLPSVIFSLIFEAKIIPNTPHKKNLNLAFWALGVALVPGEKSWESFEKAYKDLMEDK